MSADSRSSLDKPIRNGGQNCPRQLNSTDKSVRDQVFFAQLARLVWATKTDCHLAHCTRADERTCRRWLAGTNQPPASAAFVLIEEVLRRLREDIKLN